MKPILLVLLPLGLAGCPHTPAPVEAPAAPVDSGVTLPHDWWTRPALVDAPVAQLVRAPVYGLPWRVAAQRLGFPAAGFAEDSWGAFTVQAHQAGGTDQDFAVYLNPDGATAYGVIVRGKSALPGGALPTLVETARRADHGAVWDLYTYDDYVVLASEQRPLTELGCSGSAPDFICYAAVYGPGIDPRAFTTVPGNESAVLQRRITVR